MRKKTKLEIQNICRWSSSQWDITPCFIEYRPTAKAWLMKRTWIWRNLQLTVNRYLPITRWRKEKLLEPFRAVKPFILCNRVRKLTIMLQEDITKDRVESFVVEALTDGWKRSRQGTTIGYKRMPFHGRKPVSYGWRLTNVVWLLISNGRLLHAALCRKWFRVIGIICLVLAETSRWFSLTIDLGKSVTLASFAPWKRKRNRRWLPL